MRRRLSQTIETGSRTRIGARGHRRSWRWDETWTGEDPESDQRDETHRRPRTHVRHTDNVAGGGTRLGLGRTREPAQGDETHRRPRTHFTISYTESYRDLQESYRDLQQSYLTRNFELECSISAPIRSSIHRNGTYPILKTFPRFFNYRSFFLIIGVSRV